ncbi:MAG TPA: Cof-type HAD-IIB family hydrolase, partial [Tissierellales bacterium]|nr:Cof-type HAD-IIB family hydrolase [Tissierellales bacterium]
LNGIKREEILAIGDDNNDVEMILNAGIGIAMKNGSQLAKDAADIITDKDNDEAGLAFTLADALKILF